MTKVIISMCSIEVIMEKLPVTECVYNQTTKSLSVIVVVILIDLIIVASMTSISIERSLQQKIDPVGLKHTLGDKNNDQGKQMEIFPCNKEHECQTSI